MRLLFVVSLSLFASIDGSKMHRTISEQIHMFIIFELFYYFLECFWSIFQWMSLRCNLDIVSSKVKHYSISWLWVPPTGRYIAELSELDRFAPFKTGSGV